jgi:hypothetical protein
MTIFSNGTPAVAWISKTEVLAKGAFDFVKRLVQSV